MSSESAATRTSLVIGLIGGSHFVNHAYFMLLPPLFGRLQADLGVGLSRVGLAASLVGVVVVALQLPFGYLSDTRGRTPVLAASLTLGTVGAALVTTAGTYPGLLAGAGIMGAGVGGHHAAHYPMLSAATDPEARGRAFSIHGFTGSLGFAFPPAVVGTAIALGVDWRVATGAIAAVGGLYTVGCLAIFRRYVSREVTHGPVAGEGRPGPELSVRDRLASEARSLAASTGILLLTLLWFLTSLAGWGIQTYTAELLTAGYGVPGGTANLLVSVMLVVGAVAILAGGWLSDLVSARAVILGGFGALIVLTVLLAWGTLPRLVVFGLVVGYMATVKVGRPALSKLGDTLSKREDLGKNFGLLTIGISGGSAVAPYVYGVLIERTNVRVAFLTIAAVGVAAIALTFVVVGVESATGERPRPDAGSRTPED